MANIFTPSIEGDGINFTFFQKLWHKNRNEEREQSLSIQTEKEQKNSSWKQNPMRLPDTVIFQLGQPLQWYFTSERGRQTIILRKRKQNVTVEKIEEEFLRKSKSTNNGNLHQNDIVAYFIASSDCTLRNRRSIEQIHSTAAGEDKTLTHHKEPPISFGDSGESCYDNSICDIEYFNEEGLHFFLYKKRKNQSGILQRFVEPGGGKHNSQIRAICTPKLCVLERRRTKQELHDSRFGLYERAVTFEGPEVHSISLPIRGETLPGKLRSLCNRVLNHMSDATRGLKTKHQQDVRMVLHLKVDSKDRIWLLYSSSVRTIVSNRILVSDQSIELALEDHHFAQEKIDNFAQATLNVQDVIKLSPNIKLTQTANHDPMSDISNIIEYQFCPSCCLHQLEANFHPIPYKTVVTHFEQVMVKAGNQWPPPKDIIMSAGGVGFGNCSQSDANSFKQEVDKEDLVIPPVIRYVYKKLKAEGYRRYRSDPLFLHKHCKVCETCFLSYAKLVSTSFQIKIPIKLDTEMKHLHFDSKSINKISKDTEKKQRSRLKNINSNKHIEPYCSDVALAIPTFPQAIIDPPTKELDDNFDKLMPLPYDVIESPNQPLIHLLKMHDALEKSKIKANKNSQSKVKVNPYEVPLKFVDRTCSRKKRIKVSLIESHAKNHNGDNIIALDEIKEWCPETNSPEVRDEEVITMLSNALTKMIANEKEKRVYR